MTDRLTALVHPMGKDPEPTDADKAKAVSWVDAWFAREDFCPVWRANNRGYFIDSQARTEMYDRLRREWKAGRIGADAPTGLSSASPIAPASQSRRYAHQSHCARQRA